MDIFHVDLDNTLIYSYKKEIGRNKRKVEIYQGREISFVTEKTYRLLLELKKRVCIVPTTTRTIEQYGRIDLGIGRIPYALVCNGGVLLADGEQDQAWYRQSLEMVKESREEIEHAMRFLEREPDRTFELRYIRKLFVFTKCRFPQNVVRHLKEELHPQLIDVFYNGEKVYAVPKKLNKGTAVDRFRAYIGAERVFAAGDSEFDIPMLERADLAMAPAEWAECGREAAQQGGSVRVMPGRSLFSEELLEYVLECVGCRDS